MALLWTIVIVLVALLGFACWAIHLLFGQWRLHQQAAIKLRDRLTKQAEEQEAVLIALQKRINGLEVENDQQKDVIDKQAEMLHSKGITLPVVNLNDHLISETYLIREEP